MPFQNRTPCRGKGKSPQTSWKDLSLSLETPRKLFPKLWPQWHECYSTLLLWKTQVPQTGKLPFLLSIRSEHKYFFLAASAVFAGAAFALVRSQEREDKLCKVKWFLTWVSSRRNRVNNRKMPALGEKLPSHLPQSLPRKLPQKLPVACISWLSDLGFEPEAVDANPTFSIFPHYPMLELPGTGI